MYFVVSCHREENVENIKRMESLQDALVELKKKYGMRILVSLHPRTRAKISPSEWSKKGIETYKPFGLLSYINLERHAFCVLSDSGTIQEESAILGFPAVQIRCSTERPEAFDAGSIVVCGLEKRGIENAVELVTTTNVSITMPKDYLDSYVSHKVVRYIFSTLGMRKELC